jgi:hypothetical protein
MSNGPFDRRGAFAVRRQRRPLALGRAPQSAARSTSSLARPGQRRAFVDRKPNQSQSTANLPRKRAGRPHLRRDCAHLRRDCAHLRQDSRTSVPGLAHICAGNRARIPGTATHTAHTAKPSRAGDTTTNAPRRAALHRPTCGVPHAHGLVDRRRDHPARAVEQEVPDRARVALERLHGGAALLRPPLRRAGAWKPRVAFCMPRVRRVVRQTPSVDGAGSVRTAS